MSLLTFFAAGAGTGASDPHQWQPPTATPVTVPGVPTSAPWHMDSPVNITGYQHPTNGYSTDQVVHPSVVDFGGRWNGYRFWMAHTPYPAPSTHPAGLPGEAFEDPCISASNDCINWDPIVHPVNVAPTGYNADTEMVWDAALEVLHLWWMYDSNLYYTSSGDGQSWAEPRLILQDKGSTTSLQAPCILRFAENDWRMWHRGDNAARQSVVMLRFASSPTGPWSSPSEAVSTGFPAGSTYWHGGITRLTDGSLLQVAHFKGSEKIYAATSTDGGITWRWRADPVIGASPSSTWATTGMYRPYPVPHENGTHMRVWYSGTSSTYGYKLGYTELPLNMWPA